MEIINKYFPALTSKQTGQFEKLDQLYKHWNELINLISRKDINHFYEHHVLHSLSIAKVIDFRPGTTILDAGTGGGFPGVPLAIMFPEVQFKLVDSIGKKIKVINSVTDELNIKNVSTSNIRVEQINESFDFVVCRAVTKLETLFQWVKTKIKKETINELPNGLFYLKGGDLTEELKPFTSFKIYEIEKFFDEEFFKRKKVVFLDRRNSFLS